MAASSTSTRPRTLDPRLVTASIGGLCAVIGLVVGIGIGVALGNTARDMSVPASRGSGLLSPAGNHGLVYTGIPYSGAPSRSGLLTPAGNHGLVYTGIPYSGAP